MRDLCGHLCSVHTSATCHPAHHNLSNEHGWTMMHKWRSLILMQLPQMDQLERAVHAPANLKQCDTSQCTAECDDPTPGDSETETDAHAVLHLSILARWFHPRLPEGLLVGRPSVGTTFLAQAASCVSSFLLPPGGRRRLPLEKTTRGWKRLGSGLCVFQTQGLHAPGLFFFTDLYLGLTFVF